MEKFLIAFIVFVLISPCIFAQENISKEELKGLLGETYMMDKDYGSAVDQYTEILKNDPSNIKARVSLADILSWQKKYDDSIREYKKALDIEPGNIDIKIKLARAYLWSKDYAKAQGLFKNIIEKDPGNIEAKVLIADSYAYSKEFAKAIVFYKEALSAKYDREVKVKLADAYMMDKDYGSAVDQYTEILKNDPSNIKARVSLADILSWQKKYDDSIREYKKALDIEPGNIDIKIKLARAYLWSKDYAKAQGLFKNIIEKDPGNIEAKVLIADSYAYSKEFAKAIVFYKEALSAKYDREVKVKLADTLSWNKNYSEAIKLYNELISKQDDLNLRLQKARILGWTRRYDESLREYQKILDAKNDESVRLEMQSKKAYWDNRIKQAISCYKKLIDKNPENTEAMFDSSQIYSYQSMWNEAIQEYEKILQRSPGHFRAREGLEKTGLIAGHAALESGYEFFEADSASRDTDIKKNIFFNKLSVPLNKKIDLNLGYSLTGRQFSDFSDVIEHEEGLGLAYRNNPGWRADGFYNAIEYSKGIKTMHEFGGAFNFRIFDAGESRLSYERQRLEDNSTVIRGNFRHDSYNARTDFDINKRVKIGADYLYSNYSDGNHKNEPGCDILYYLSLEPKALYIKYRYFFRDFNKKVSEYFSPQDFSTHAIAVHWRHFLNKEEVFFGADNIYYDLGYDISLDSTGIVGHKFTGGFAWDINKRLQVKAEGQCVLSSASVYKDKRALVSVKYYF